MNVKHISVVVAALIASSAAHASERPIACLYDHVAHNNKIARGALESLVASNMVAHTSDEKIAMARIGSEIGKCQAEFGWSLNRQHAVFDYLHARLLYDFQRDALDTHHITYQMIENLVTSMSPEVRASYAVGTVNHAMVQDAAAKLAAAGASIDPAAATDPVFEVSLAKAIVATVVESNAEQKFAAR